MGKAPNDMMIFKDIILIEKVDYTSLVGCNLPIDHTFVDKTVADCKETCDLATTCTGYYWAVAIETAAKCMLFHVKATQDTDTTNTCYNKVDVETSIELELRKRQEQATVIAKATAGFATMDTTTKVTYEVALKAFEDADLKRDVDEKYAAKYTEMTPEHQAVFDVDLLKFKKAKETACLIDTTSLECIKADEIR